MYVLSVVKLTEGKSDSSNYVQWADHADNLLQVSRVKLPAPLLTFRKPGFSHTLQNRAYPSKPWSTSQIIVCFKLLVNIYPK